MRWRTKPIEPKPKIGEYKEFIVFAWIPTRVQNHIVWLENYTTQMYYTYDGWAEAHTLKDGHRIFHKRQLYDEKENA